MLDQLVFTIILYYQTFQNCLLLCWDSRDSGVASAGVLVQTGRTPRVQEGLEITMFWSKAGKNAILFSRRSGSGGEEEWTGGMGWAESGRRKLSRSGSGQNLSESGPWSELKSS